LNNLFKLNVKAIFRFLLSRALWKLGLSKMLIIKKRLFRMRLYPTSMSIQYWDNSRAHEKDEEFFVKYLKTGDTVIDVGANIGTLTLTAASLVGNKGRVFSIEPHPTIFKYLKENVSFNYFNNIKLFNIAVGDKEGMAIFSDKHNDDENQVIENGRLKVEVKRLDDLLNKELTSVDLVKVDVEGYEKFVFLGALKLFKKTECVYYESIADNFTKYNYSLGEIITILSSVGLHSYELRGKNITRITMQSTYYNNGHIPNNLFAIRDLDCFVQRTWYKII